MQMKNWKMKEEVREGAGEAMNEKLDTDTGSPPNVSGHLVLLYIKQKSKPSQQQFQILLVTKCNVD